MAKKTAVRNTFAQPISPMAQNMYNALLKRNEKDILNEADPKVTYITDNNMQVTKFISLGGDAEKRDFKVEEFMFMGQKVILPYEKVNYNVVDMQTGKITATTVKYLDTQDTEMVAELYKEFYRLANFLVSQEIAMKGLLPALTEKGEYVVDPKTGLPLVGAQYLERYFGLTHAASQEEKAMANAISDIQRWAYGSFVYQIKTSEGLWREIHNKLRSGEITKYGVGPTLDNIGIADFRVSEEAIRPNHYVSGTTSPDRPTFDITASNKYKSDLANMLVSTQNGQFVANPQPQAMQQPAVVQPSVVAQAPTQGPIQPTTPKGANTKTNIKK